MRKRLFDCVKKNDERGMGENVGAVTALEYATRKKIVEYPDVTISPQYWEIMNIMFPKGESHIHTTY